MRDVVGLPPGIHPDVDEATYHALPYLGSGDIKMLIEDCPAVFRWTKDNPQENEPSRDMEIGTVAHLLALQPERFAERVVVIRHADYRKGEAKDLRANAYANGLAPILEADLDIALEMNRSLREQIGDMFTGGQAECTLIWDDPRTKQRCKARVDYRLPSIHIDYKTTTDPSKNAFRRRIVDNGHHLQAAHYGDGEEVLTGRRPSWLWVVQSTKAPYLACMYEPAPSWLHFGGELVRAALDTHRACIEADEWPGYGDGVQLIEPPGFMAYDFEERRAAGLVRKPERRGKPALTKEQVALSININRPLGS